MCSPSPCDYSATTRDITQALYSVNITTFGLLTTQPVVCLGFAMGFAWGLPEGPTLVPTLCQREYSHVTAPDVGTGFALAISMPTLAASRVGTSCAIANSVPMLLASCVGTSCAIARSMPTLGCPLCLTRGEGVDLC